MNLIQHQKGFISQTKTEMNERDDKTQPISQPHEAQFIKTANYKTPESGKINKSQIPIKNSDFSIKNIKIRDLNYK